MPQIMGTVAPNIGASGELIMLIVNISLVAVKWNSPLTRSLPPVLPLPEQLVLAVAITYTVIFEVCFTFLLINNDLGQYTIHFSR